MLGKKSFKKDFKEVLFYMFSNSPFCPMSSSEKSSFSFSDVVLKFLLACNKNKNISPLVCILRYDLKTIKFTTFKSCRRRW